MTDAVGDLPSMRRAYATNLSDAEWSYRKYHHNQWQINETEQFPLLVLYKPKALIGSHSSWRRRPLFSKCLSCNRTLFSWQGPLCLVRPFVINPSSSLSIAACFTQLLTKSSARLSSLATCETGLSEKRTSPTALALPRLPYQAR